MMAQSRAFVDASHALNDLSHAIALLESENAKLREQGARLFDKTLELGTENEKLRGLVRKWYPHMLKRVGRDALKQWGQMDVVKELGIEAE